MQEPRLQSLYRAFHHPSRTVGRASNRRRCQAAASHIQQLHHRVRLPDQRDQRSRSGFQTSTSIRMAKFALVASNSRASPACRTASICTAVTPSPLPITSTTSLTTNIGKWLPQTPRKPVQRTRRLHTDQRQICRNRRKLRRSVRGNKRRRCSKLVFHSQLHSSRRKPSLWLSPHTLQRQTLPTLPISATSRPALDSPPATTAMRET